MPASGRQLASLTGLRFFAALAVVMYHLHLYFTPIAENLNLFAYGYTGVSFFFILSGFVLSWSHRDDASPGTFYWHRIARIWPLHLLTTVLAVFTPTLPRSSAHEWWTAAFVLSLTQAWVPASPFLNAFNGVSWSLSCEAFFYLVFPLLHKRLATSGLAARTIIVVPTAMLLLAISLTSVSSMTTADYLLGTAPLYRLGEFVLGISLARLIKTGCHLPFGSLQAAILVGISHVGLLVWTGLNGPVGVLFANLIMVPGFLALIYACTKADLAGRSGLLGSQVLVRLGQWSYALYLIHELVIRVARPYADFTGEATVLAAFVILMSISLSGLLHEFVEKPAERWLRRLRQTYTWRRQVLHP
ncbi:acyltransferase [Pseudarthrobacter sp. NPDC089323]